MLIILIALLWLCAFSPAPQQDDFLFSDEYTSEDIYIPDRNLYFSHNNNNYLEIYETNDEINKDIYIEEKKDIEETGIEDKTSWYNCDKYSFSEEEQKQENEENINKSENKEKIKTIYYADGHIEEVYQYSDEYLYCRSKWQKKPVSIEIAGKQAVFYYDGKEHEVSGYEIRSISDDKYTENDFSFTGNAYLKKSGSRLWKMGLTSEMFVNNNNDFDAEFIIVDDGYLYIIPPDAIITITGKKESYEYDGESHSTFGYDASVQICESQTIVADETGHYDCQTYSLIDPTSKILYTCGEYNFASEANVPEICHLYRSEDLQLLTGAYVERTDPGITKMGLNDYSFLNTNTEFETVLFNITDGYVEITGEKPIDETISSETVNEENKLADETNQSDVAETPEKTEDLSEHILIETFDTNEDESQNTEDNIDNLSEELKENEQIDLSIEPTQSDTHEEDKEGYITDEISETENKINITSSAGTVIYDGDMITITASISNSHIYSEYLYIWEELSADGTWKEVFRSSRNSYEYTVTKDTVNVTRRVTVLGMQY